MQNYVGQQIDRYRITERLGMGGMAVVYKAYDTRLERDVALKLIRTESIPQDQHDRLFKRFEREAKAQARFKHPHIVAVHDYGEVDNSPYLVMDFVSGGTLKERLHGPVDWRQAVRWLIPVAEALSYAHKEGIIHRDVKPANILFDKDDQPILTDFGIAKVLETDEATLTGTGLGVGTPEYMAPEQWQGKTSPATDQYALGVVLYELITGRKPYSADTPAAIILMQATEPLQAPSNLVGGIPEPVEKVLYKALARDQQDRYQDMGTFTNTLRSLFEGIEDSIKLANREESNKSATSRAFPKSLQSEEITRDTFDVNSQDFSKYDSSPSVPSGKDQKKRHSWIIYAILGIVLLGVFFGVNQNLPLKGQESENMASSTDSNSLSEGETQVPALTISPTPTVLPTEPVIFSTSTNDYDDAEIVLIPGGKFVMGSSNEDLIWVFSQEWCSNCESDWFYDEQPQHYVYLDSYWIYATEVTNSQFRRCILDGGCSGELSRYLDNKYPAAYVSWEQAENYCNWAGGRLPTEAEWEKAARGTDGRYYPWGNRNPDISLLNFNNLIGQSALVGSFPEGVSHYGALDMAGNLWEWVSDWYQDDYYSDSPYFNPLGPSTGEWKVLRGGSWDISGLYQRVTNRGSDFPETDDFYIGFRCVLEAEEVDN